VKIASLFIFAANKFPCHSPARLGNPERSCPAEPQENILAKFLTGCGSATGIQVSHTVKAVKSDLGK